MKKFSKLLRYTIISSIVFSLVTTLFLNASYFYPFISSKIFIFRSMVEIGFLAYLLLAWMDSSARPSRSFLTMSVAVYVLAMLISVFAGVNTAKSFWGTIERGEGLFTFLHIFALFVMAVGTLRERKHWATLWGVSFGVSVITAIYGIGQLFGASGFINTTGERLSSTVGNPSFFAAYLMMNVFIGLYLASTFAKKYWIKILIWSGVIVNAFVMFQTQTRGAVIGFVAGFLLLGVVSMFVERNVRLKKMWLGVVLSIIILIGAVFAFRDASIVQESKVLRRFANISLSDITTQSRLLTWQASLKAFQDRPVFGWGYENYNIAFDKYFPTPIYKDSGSQIWFDRAHNIVLDQLVMFGIVGLIAYLIVFFTAFWMLVGKIKSKRKDNKSVASYSILVAMLVAYGIQNLFVFDSLPTYMTFYLFLGYVVWLCSTDKASPGDGSVNHDSRIVGSFGGLLLIVLIFVLLPINKKASSANLIGAQSIREINGMDMTDSFNLMDRALSMNTNQSNELKFAFANKVVEEKAVFRKNPEVGEKAFKRAQEYASDLVEDEPLNARYYILSMAVNNAANGVIETPLEQMKDLAERAIERSPTRPHIYYELAQAYMNNDKFDGAVDAMSKAQELSPDVGTVYRNFMLVYSRQGKWDEVGKVLSKAMDEESNVNLTNSDVSFIIELLGAGERYDELIVFYEWLAIGGRLGGENYAQLAALYAMVGRYDDARKAVNRAVSMDPGLTEEAEAFLGLIGKQEKESQSVVE